MDCSDWRDVSALGLVRYGMMQRYPVIHTNHWGGGAEIATKWPSPRFLCRPGKYLITELFTQMEFHFGGSIALSSAPPHHHQPYVILSTNNSQHAEKTEKD